MKCSTNTDAAPRKGRHRYSFHAWWMSYLLINTLPLRVKEESTRFLEQVSRKRILFTPSRGGRSPFNMNDKGRRPHAEHVSREQTTGSTIRRPEERLKQ